jgi:hypothetical protein
VEWDYLIYENAKLFRRNPTLLKEVVVTLLNEDMKTKKLSEKQYDAVIERTSSDEIKSFLQLRKKDIEFAQDYDDDEKNVDDEKDSKKDKTEEKVKAQVDDSDGDKKNIKQDNNWRNLFSTIWSRFSFDSCRTKTRGLIQAVSSLASKILSLIPFFKW